MIAYSYRRNRRDGQVTRSEMLPLPGERPGEDIRNSRHVRIQSERVFGNLLISYTFGFDIPLHFCDQIADQVSLHRPFEGSLFFRNTPKPCRHIFV